MFTPDEVKISIEDHYIRYKGWIKGPFVKVRVEVEKVLKQLPQAVQVPQKDILHF